MGFFGSLFRSRGEAIENENTSKPFHLCRTSEERLDWFSRTRPWHKVPRSVVEAFDTKFAGQKPVMFELFVVTSMRANLVGQYAQMNTEFAKGEVACAMAGGMLVKLGGPVAQQVVATKDGYAQRGRRPSESEIEALIKNAEIAKDCLESAVAVCPNMFPAYPALAVLLASIGSADEGVHYAKQGLAVVKKQRAEATPFHLSSLESIRDAPKDLAIIEQTLQQLVDAFAADGIY